MILETSSTFTLRLAQAEEAPMLSALMTETFLAAYGHVAPADSLERHIARSYAAPMIGERIAAAEIEVYVLKTSDGRGAGYVQLGLNVPAPEPLAGRRTLEVQRCYMRPEHIGAGGAGQLIAQAQRRAAELDREAVHLSVYQLAPRAVRFYEKHGFRRAAAIKYYIDHVEFDDWLMVWQRH
jgi:GNAT superfamily N-acetyltransferase